MKVLVLGAKGMLGQELVKAFSDNEVDGVHHFQAVKPASSASKTAAMEATRNPRGVLRQRS